MIEKDRITIIKYWCFSLYNEGIEEVKVMLQDINFLSNKYAYAKLYIYCILYIYNHILFILYIYIIFLYEIIMKQMLVVYIMHMNIAKYIG